MSRPALEVADIFRDFGAAWRTANAGYVSLGQLKVMSAIENCRTATLGGHVMRCEDCAYTTIAYNSCRNRHCPKCQGAAAREWLADQAVSAPKQASNSRLQAPSPPSTSATAPCRSRHSSPPSTLRSPAHAIRVSQTPIASAAARSRNQPAGSFFGGFRTPARVPVAASRTAGIRNPYYERELVKTFLRGAYQFSNAKGMRRPL